MSQKTQYGDSQTEPFELDTTEQSADRLKQIRGLFDAEYAERLIKAAEELGGFSVKVFARAGDHYTTLHELDGRLVASSPIPVPDNRVILGISNTGNPEQPTDLGPLYSFLES